MGRPTVIPCCFTDGSALKTLMPTLGSPPLRLIKKPPVVLDFLNSEINKALGAKSLQERFETLSLEAIRMDRPTLRRYVESEVGKWGRLVKDLQIQVQ